MGYNLLIGSVRVLASIGLSIIITVYRTFSVCSVVSNLISRPVCSFVRRFFVHLPPGLPYPIVALTLLVPAAAAEVFVPFTRLDATRRAPWSRLDHYFRIFTSTPEVKRRKSKYCFAHVVPKRCAV